MPSTLGTVTVFLPASVDIVSSMLEVVSVLSFLEDLVLPTSLTITNIVTIRIITAIPIPIIFIIRSSLSLLSSSISTSSSSSDSSILFSVSSLLSSSSMNISSSSDNMSSSSSALTSLALSASAVTDAAVPEAAYIGAITTKSSSGITSDFLRSVISSAAD